MARKYFCKIGKSEVTIVGASDVDGIADELASGSIEMVSDNNDATMVAQADGTWAVDNELLRIKAKEDRDTALQSSTYSLADGSEYQVRPQDLANFQITIDGGVSEEWVLADNTIRLTTIAELQEILIAGIAQGKAVWTDYKTTIRAL